MSDEEFAAEAFPFEVVRNMTPGFPGVEVDAPPDGGKMPRGAPLVAYVGHTDERHRGKPVVWGATGKSTPIQNTPEFADVLMRAYVMASADMQPAESPEKRAYDAALARDEAAGGETYAARDAFASAYLPRVRALVSR